MLRLGQFVVRHRTRILIGAAAFLVLFTLIGFFVVPPILKSVLATQLTAALHREVTIAEVRVNPFALSATVRGLAVKEPKGPETFASFEELYLNLEASSLFRWAAVVREVRLTKPFVRVVRRADRVLQLLRPVAGSATAAQRAGEAGALLRQQHRGD